MAENLNVNNTATPGAPVVKPVTPAVSAAPASPVAPAAAKPAQAKKETIRISLPPKPTGHVGVTLPNAGAKPAAAPAAAQAPAVPAGTPAPNSGLKMSNAAAPKAAAAPAAAAKKKSASASASTGKVQMIDQILAILVAVVCIASVVVAYMLTTLGEEAGF